jgi:formylglycine-generating enzyme required for sulfatase activity
VTQADYRALMEATPSNLTDLDDTKLPVENVSWYDAVLYCNARSKRDGKDTVYTFTAISKDRHGCRRFENLTIDLGKNGYHLPTEAEWEYACRAGTTTEYYWGDDTAAATAGQYEWYGNDSVNQTHPVGQKKPNAFGLYDMCGNVMEWCNDWYKDRYDSTNTQTDPAGPATGHERVVRGGMSGNIITVLCSARRGSAAPCSNAYGFRCVCSR